MKLPEAVMDCQLPYLQRISEGAAKPPRASLLRQVKLMVRRRLTPQAERQFKSQSNDVINWLGRITGRPKRPAVQPARGSAVHLKAGDVVRVRPRPEIEATLNNWRQLRGCTFMPEMVQYCGTTLRVLKPLERFVDERDLRVKTSKGIVLLEGVVCQGTADFGRCDRSCLLFWREEWLEKIDEVSA